MEKVATYLQILALVVAVTITGCSTTGHGVSSGVQNSSKEVAVTNASIELSDYLRRVPGVTVMGNGPNARVTIRGVNTFLGSTSPLFVLDGVKVGRSFQAVYSSVNMHDVSSIEVLKGPDASAYGVEGGNGVVLIKYK